MSCPCGIPVVSNLCASRRRTLRELFFTKKSVLKMRNKAFPDFSLTAVRCRVLVGFQGTILHHLGNSVWTSTPHRNVDSRPSAKSAVSIKIVDSCLMNSSGMNSSSENPHFSLDEFVKRESWILTGFWSPLLDFVDSSTTNSSGENSRVLALLIRPARTRGILLYQFVALPIRPASSYYTNS